MKLIWKATHLEYLDPRTKSCEQEVQQIIHLQSVANNLPDSFTDTQAANASENHNEICAKKAWKATWFKIFKTKKKKRKQEGAPNGT